MCIFHDRSNQIRYITREVVNQPSLYVIRDQCSSVDTTFDDYVQPFKEYHSVETLDEECIGDVVRLINQTTMKEEDREFFEKSIKAFEKRVCINGRGWFDHR